MGRATGDCYVEAETKTERSRRSIILAGFALDALKKHLARQEDARWLAGDASILEPSPPMLPGQQEFHSYLRALAQSAVRTVIEAVMREELDAFIGVAWGECSPKRKGYRNGSYPRDLVTSTGRLEDIKVPRDREGQFHTQTFERFRRYEPHIAEGLTQMFVAGTSTHKVGEVAQTLLGVAPSASTISRLNQSLAQQFETWRQRPLQEHWRILYLDGVHFSIRHGEKADSTLILTALGVDLAGNKEVLALRACAEEDKDGWACLLQDLRSRGATHIDLIVTDGHDGVLALNRIDHDAESILTPIAMNRPASVWTFFERRVRDKRDREDGYQAIPYELHSLVLPLARDVDSATATLRKWYKAGDSMFRFTGGLLLRAVFPTFTDELASSLNQIIARGSDEDYDFAIHLLENYHETSTHEVVKELIDLLPENDPKLNRLDICLSNTGVVSGEFGMVAAYRKKKEEISLWQSDSRPKVREFAESYVKRMEQQIASEQRSAEIHKEMRKRDYEVESE